MSSSIPTQRPHSSSSASQRPPSSASRRPSSSASLRPSSSLSANRPSTSASVRSISRVSHRPTSRVSRPATRQSSRILPLCQALVTQVTELSIDNNEDNFRTAVDFVLNNLEQPSKASASLDLSAVDKLIQGHARKSRINSRDSVADALESSYKCLKDHFAQKNDLDQEIKLSHLPDHLQLLILLSNPTTQSTVYYADQYLENLINPPQPPPVLTWKDILAEEPFEGQHWEGAYGLPPGSTVENWEEHSTESTPPLSPIDDSDDFDDSLSSIETDLHQHSYLTSPINGATGQTFNPRRHDYRDYVDKLQATQYWKNEWRSDVRAGRRFDLEDASTLGPSIHRIMAKQITLSIDGPDQVKYIHEHDAVREILMALQGRKNLMIEIADTNAFTFAPSPGALKLVHLTLTSQASLLSSFARIVTTIGHLRRVVAAIFSKTYYLPAANAKPSYLAHANRRSMRTLEAISDAVDKELQTLDKWCTQKEEQICKALAGVGEDVVVSLLRLEKEIRDNFSSTFEVLFQIFHSVINQALHLVDTTPLVWDISLLLTRVPPASITTLLLDTLIGAIQEQLSLGDSKTANALTRVFTRTAEPVWSMIRVWLKNGTPRRDPTGRHEGYGEAGLEDEFFIEENGLPLLDPDFWTEGYALREGSGSDDDSSTRPKPIPIFLAHVAEMVLSSGKSVGLLRALGVPPLLDTDVGDWCEFQVLLASDIGPEQGGLSTETLSRLLYDHLLPRCEVSGIQLTRVLVDDCDLWRHLSAIEDLYLMRKGDAMSNFTDVLFANMDSRQNWNDFHFLNTAFRDVVDASPFPWIETSLVRLSYRGNKDKLLDHTVKVIDGLLLEYAVPFPLTYIFGPTVLKTYCSLFVLFLQIRRAKDVLERILVRGTVQGTQVAGELKAFYAMRSRLSWFINTLLNFLTTYVVHTCVLEFHGALRGAKSLDEMIKLHGTHLEKIQSRCLLLPNTSSLYRAILSILDIALHFSTYFISFTGDSTTHDISRQSVSMRHHRSRRQRRQRRNIIGFSQSLQDSIDSSDDDEDDDFEDTNNVPGLSYSIQTQSPTDGGFADRLDKMSTELDELVGFIRRGVGSLAGGTSEAASAFGIFAFALEDWDT